MTHAVRVVDGGDWIVFDESSQVEIGGNVYRGRHLARMSEDERLERGLDVVVAAGVPPVQGLGEPPVLSDLEPEPTWLWSPGGVLSYKALRVREIKAEAGRRILAIMTDEQQRNALARGQEVIYLHGPDPDAWPTEEQIEYAAIMAKWSQIKDIRAASDAIEADLPEDAEGLSAFDAAIADGWPT